MSTERTWKVRHLVTATLLCIAFLSALLSSSSFAKSSVVWRAEYFDNMNLTGTPVAVVDESEINHRWRNHGPGHGIGIHYFSVRWTTTAEFGSGTYLFKAYVDDGVRVVVDGQVIIDEWRNQPETLFEREVAMTAGVHTVQVDYYQHIGDATAIVWWEWLAGAVTPRWRVEYFNNPYLVGAPVAVGDATDVNYNWGASAPAPGVAADNFSARWTASVHFEATTTYTFTVAADDGARVWIDGGLLLDQWGGGTGSASRLVTLGSHPMIVEYYEASGDAAIQLSWVGGPTPTTTTSPTAGPSVTPTGPAAEIIVDDQDAGFEKGGPTSSWYSRSVGYKGHTYWTYNSDAQVYNYAKWIPQLPQAGDYEVFAFIPRQRADTKSARYRIHHNGMDHAAVVDQSIHFDAWVSLGTYYFAAGGDEYVYLDDVTGEPYAAYKIGFDAVKFAGEGGAVPTGTPTAATPTPTNTLPAATPTATTPSGPTNTPPVTPVQPTATPTLPACSITPILGFGRIWTTYATVRDRLGCPVELETNTWSGEETFIGGYLFWRGDLRLIYALYSDGTWESFIDTWNEGDLEWDPTIVPPAGYYQPKRGFGKVWREQPGVRDKLSWATTEERGFNGSWQAYLGGQMLWSDVLGIFVLYNDGTWSRFL
jgi:hypothetical protein